jgi:hypothetical protein
MKGLSVVFLVLVVGSFTACNEKKKDGISSAPTAKTNNTDGQGPESADASDEAGDSVDSGEQACGGEIAWFKCEKAKGVSNASFCAQGDNFSEGKGAADDCPKVFSCDEGPVGIDLSGDEMPIVIFETLEQCKKVKTKFEQDRKKIQETQGF